MPLTISNMKKETKNLSFYMGEETPDNLVNFVYRPNEFTPGLEDKFNDATEAELKSEAFLKIICDLVVSWDIIDIPEDEGGKLIPFMIRDENEESSTFGQLFPNLLQLKDIPSPVYSKLMDAIAEDQKPKKEQVTGSLAG